MIVKTLVIRKKDGFMAWNKKIWTCNPVYKDYGHTNIYKATAPWTNNNKNYLEEKEHGYKQQLPMTRTPLYEDEQEQEQKFKEFRESWKNVKYN